MSNRSLFKMSLTLFTDFSLIIIVNPLYKKESFFLFFFFGLENLFHTHL